METRDETLALIPKKLEYGREEKKGNEIRNVPPSLSIGWGYNPIYTSGCSPVRGLYTVATYTKH